MTTPATEQPYERTDGPVHLWFSLSYANFAVQHRARLQSMPLEWQQRYADLMEELYTAYDAQPDPEFEVTTVRWESVGDLSSAEKAQLGIGPLSDDEPDDADCEEWSDRNGRALQRHDRVAIPVPDPVPHYKHAYLPPDEDAIAALRAARAATVPG
jgi:hypothetical protein